MLKLRFKDNKHNAVWLVEPKVSIGRSPKSDMVVNLPEIAEHHAEILVKHESLTLVNVAGSGDLKVNGKAVQKAVRLKANDEVSVGATVLQIVDPKTEFAAQKPAMPKSDGSTGWALKPNHSALANRIFPIKQETVIGRSAECDISLAAAHLSRRHVKLTVQDGLLFVKDLGSANGTYLNGERVVEARVKRGDELRFDTLSFGVIGPVEDMDKTTIRRLEPAAAVASPTKKNQAPGRARRNDGETVRPMREQMQAVNEASDDMVVHANVANTGFGVEVPSRRKSLWVLAVFLVVVIGVAFAYTQGLLDSLLS